MKKAVPVSILLLLCAAFFCCGDDDPTDPKNGGDDGSPYSGSFSVSNQPISNDCAAPAPPPAVMNVLIEGDTIIFGGIKGAWDEATLTGTSIPDTMAVPVLPECIAYSMAVYVITYSSPDSFSGTYGADFWKDPGCPNPDPCSFRYEIVGSR